MLLSKISEFFSLYLTKQIPLKRLLSLTKVPYLFSFLCLALIALMTFQVSWLSTSSDLIKEQFDQKVNLAIGSALTDFNASHHTTLNLEELQGCSEEDVIKYFPAEKTLLSAKDQRELERTLSGYMNCYGIDDKYSVEILDNSCKTAAGSYCCSLNSVKGSQSNCMLGVSFEGREAYLIDKIRPMIFSSILIFILLASASFIILWSLIKQKRITENNIDFFNNTAHELKTPLTNISLALNLLSKKYDVIKEDKYAKIIKSENSKLADQIERVLFLSKMENGEYELKQEVLSLNQIIQEVTDNMQLVIDQYQGQLILNLSKDNPKITGDYFHISNVFRNLIDNALKYCEKQPIINITVESLADQVKVSVEDNGIGISSSDQCHIFDKFQRVNTGNVRRAKGFGIGLSYVKTVIEMHQGLINVKSEVNHGSKFQLIIPNTV